VCAQYLRAPVLKCRQPLGLNKGGGRKVKENTFSTLHLNNWIDNTLRQLKWRQDHLEENVLKNITVKMFHNIEKQISLACLFDNMFHIVEDTDLSMKDLQTLRQLNSLSNNQQETHNE
jgi:hypothetical protein